MKGVLEDLSFAVKSAKKGSAVKDLEHQNELAKKKRFCDEITSFNVNNFTRKYYLGSQVKVKKIVAGYITKKVFKRTS